MTDRKFTPPTEFPAEYVTSDGRKAVILGVVPANAYKFVGYVVLDEQKTDVCWWTHDGSYTYNDRATLHDLPKKQVLWANDVMGTAGVGFWWESREKADEHATSSRIAVIRREWVEGQPPQYFVEEV